MSRRDADAGDPVTKIKKILQELRNSNDGDMAEKRIQSKFDEYSMIYCKASYMVNTLKALQRKNWEGTLVISGQVAGDNTTKPNNYHDNGENYEPLFANLRENIFIVEECFLAKQSKRGQMMSGFWSALIDKQVLRGLGSKSNCGETFSHIYFEACFLDEAALNVLKQVVNSNKQIRHITWGKWGEWRDPPSFASAPFFSFFDLSNKKMKETLNEIKGILDERQEKHLKKQRDQVKKQRDVVFRAYVDHIKNQGANKRFEHKRSEQEQPATRSEAPASWWERFKRAVRRLLLGDGALDSSIQRVDPKSQKVQSKEQTQAQVQSQNEQKSGDEKTHDELTNDIQNLENDDNGVTRLERDMASLREIAKQAQESGVDIQEENLEQRKDVLDKREQALIQAQEKLVAGIKELRSSISGNTEEIQEDKDEKVAPQKNAKIWANIEELQEYKNSVARHLQIVQGLLDYEVDDNAKEKLEKIKSNENLHHFYMAAKTALRAWVYQVYNGSLREYDNSLPARTEQIVSSAVSVDGVDGVDSLANIVGHLPDGTAKIKAAVAVEASANVLGFIGKHVPVVGSAFQLIASLLDHYNKIQKESWINRSRQVLGIVLNPELFIEQLARNLAVYQEATIERLSTNDPLSTSSNNEITVLFARWMSRLKEKASQAKGEWQVTEVHKFAYWQVTQLLSSIFDNQLKYNERGTQGELLTACLDQLGVSALSPTATVQGVSSKGITLALSSSRDSAGAVLSLLAQMRSEQAQMRSEIATLKKDKVKHGAKIEALEEDKAEQGAKIEALEEDKAERDKKLAQLKAELEKVKKSRDYQSEVAAGTFSVGNGSQQQLQLGLQKQDQHSDVLLPQGNNLSSQDIMNLMRMMPEVLAEIAVLEEAIQTLTKDFVQTQESVRSLRRSHYSPKS